MQDWALKMINRANERRRDEIKDNEIIHVQDQDS